MAVLENHGSNKNLIQQRLIGTILSNVNDAYKQIKHRCKLVQDVITRYSRGDIYIDATTVKEISSFAPPFVTNILRKQKRSILSTISDYNITNQNQYYITDEDESFLEDEEEETKQPTKTFMIEGVAPILFQEYIKRTQKV
jgi:hypothetical protein